MKWLVMLKQLAESKLGQWLRRSLATKSAEELRRRENEKQIDDLARSDRNA